jgi:hypothetical protein
VVYDDDVFCTNTSIGLVSPALCLPLFIPAPQPFWAHTSHAQPLASNGTFPVFVGAVGCRSFFVAAAEDANYDLSVLPDPHLPPGASLISRCWFCCFTIILQYKSFCCRFNGRAELLFLPHHGTEGKEYKVCFTAVVVQTGLQLPQACALFQVQRCAVCIGGSLLSGSPPLMSALDVSKQLIGDSNWIRIWLVICV